MDLNLNKCKENIPHHIHFFKADQHCQMFTRTISFGAPFHIQLAVDEDLFKVDFAHSGFNLGSLWYATIKKSILLKTF